MKIITQQGDATSTKPSASGVIIAHLCNNVGAWGRGFVLAVDKLSLVPKFLYKEYCKKNNNEVDLGRLQMVEIEPQLWVANMIAQNGIDKSAFADGVLVNYPALRTCIREVFKRAVMMGCDVHMPEGIGAGLAGGDKATIFAIIEEESQKFASIESVLGTEQTIHLWEYMDTTSNSYIPQADEPVDKANSELNADVQAAVGDFRGLDLD